MAEVINWRDKKVLEDGCGGSIYKVVDSDNSDLKNVEISMCIFSPDEIGLLHYHNRMEEIYFILGGKGELKLDGKRYSVIAEDAVTIPSGVSHQIRNTSSEEPLRFLSINSPGWDPSDMIPTDSDKE
jgi:mannose-6-phosphate isomerase-like protein (cupin superfamily)